MNKLLVLLGAFIYVFSAQPVMAQKSKVQTAWNYLKYDELDKAKLAIDEAAANESTIAYSKTWYYRGLIYQKMFKHEKYGSLDPNCLKVAYDSYTKALELDPNYEYKPEIEQNKRYLAAQIYTSGVEKFNKKEYAPALTDFEYLIAKDANDTLSIVNAAFCSEKLNENAKAKTYYQRLIAMNYDDPRIYIFYGNLLKNEDNMEEAAKIIKAGRQKYPADNSLIIEELNMYLTSGKDKEALESLDFAIQNDPQNKNLYYAKGTVLDRLKRSSEAAAAYKKSLELDPEFFDANYNLGAMYFNEGAIMANKANDITNNAEYDKAKKAYEAKFREAMPYLEKALTVKPDDASTQSSLKQIYARLNEMDKYNALKKQMEGQ